MIQKIEWTIATILLSCTLYLLGELKNACFAIATGWFASWLVAKRMDSLAEKKSKEETYKRFIDLYRTLAISMHNFARVAWGHGCVYPPRWHMNYQNLTKVHGSVIYGWKYAVDQLANTLLIHLGEFKTLLMELQTNCPTPELWDLERNIDWVNDVLSIQSNLKTFEEESQGTNTLFHLHFDNSIKNVNMGIRGFLSHIGMAKGWWISPMIDPVFRVDLIRLKAANKWKKLGRPSNKDIDIWLETEKIVDERLFSKLKIAQQNMDVPYWHPYECPYSMAREEAEAK